jgi:hypothetical protein
MKSSDDKSAAQAKIWAGMTPTQRDARVAQMSEGRRAAKAKRARGAKLKQKRSTTSGLDATFEMAKMAAALLEVAGSREAVNHLLDIVELVGAEV